MKENSIGFIGCGKMAQAIIKGIVKSEFNSRFAITAYDINAEALKEACDKFEIGMGTSNADVINKCAVIVLAVKPQHLPEVMASFNGALTDAHLVLSIVAGVSIAGIQSKAGKKIPVVRVMPNTPALIGAAAAGYCFSREIKEQDKKTAKIILSTFCRVMVELPEEKINAVTALSGSGPAYVFYFAEAMLKAAEEMNFDRKDAKELIAQTFIGSAQLMMSSEEEPEVLRQNVTSKKGTTESALNVMEKSGIKESFIKAIIAAKERADELGK
jgi:pyrroline-5-carboxylate reductase